jgi:CRP-like cAMP-binding protein
VGEIGLLVPDAPHTKTVRATTNVSVLAMDEATFRHLMQVSQVTAEHMEQVAEAHMSRPAPPTQ